jgi:hypothetical protein
MSDPNDNADEEIKVECSGAQLMITCRSRKDFDRIRQTVLAFGKPNEIPPGMDQTNWFYIIRDRPRPPMSWTGWGCIAICGAIVVLVATICAIGIGEMIYEFSESR